MASGNDDTGGSSAALAVAVEPVELVRAHRASDLWSAIEAAQSSRVVVHDELDDPAEETALSTLAGAIDRAIEVWDDEGVQNKAPLLNPIDDGLAALTPRGFSLYWGCIDRQVALGDGENVAMRVAVIVVSRSLAPTREVAMPLVLEAVDAGPGEGDGGGF